MFAFAIPIDYCSSSYLPCLLLQPSIIITNDNLKIQLPFLSTKFAKLLSSCTNYLVSHLSSTSHSSNSGTTFLDNDDDDDDDGYYSYAGEELDTVSGNGFSIEVKELQNNSRRIRSKITINASLDTVWKILTGYDKLADFLPGLAVSKLIDKKENCVRLYQIGQQNLAFGLKFNAKAILDCYERDLQIFASRKKRDIEFEMVEGDFQVFKGKWSIEQLGKPNTQDSLSQEFVTTLLYLVDVKPKLWLPVHLIEGRICKEIKSNLSCIREEAQKVINNALNDQ